MKKLYKEIDKNKFNELISSTVLFTYTMGLLGITVVYFTFICSCIYTVFKIFSNTAGKKNFSYFKLSRFLVSSFFFDFCLLMTRDLLMDDFNKNRIF